MILWTIQPVEIWNIIQKTGVYRCNPAKSSMADLSAEAYDWLVRNMKERIGPPPEGVEYPVWAWYMQEGKHKKPDLRRERWAYGAGNESYVCIEFEITSDQVLLSDFDLWHFVLNDWYLSETEDEDDQMYAIFDTLPSDERRKFCEESWKGIFDVTKLDNEWMRRGYWVQATIWELRKEMIRDARFFVTGKYKHN
ncbi:MAG: DUF3841 domain-containing protein [Lachnospiraceae bacterium]|nr:DUF3841 domain-containing protein [Lachnospiraceae bacterium]